MFKVARVVGLLVFLCGFLPSEISLAEANYSSDSLSRRKEAARDRQYQEQLQQQRSAPAQTVQQVPVPSSDQIPDNSPHKYGLIPFPNAGSKREVKCFAVYFDNHVTAAEAKFKETCLTSTATCKDGINGDDALCPDGRTTVKEDLRNKEYISANKKAPDCSSNPWYAHNRTCVNWKGCQDIEHIDVNQHPECTYFKWAKNDGCVQLFTTDTNVNWCALLKLDPLNPAFSNVERGNSENTDNFKGPNYKQESNVVLGNVEPLSVRKPLPPPPPAPAPVERPTHRGDVQSAAPIEDHGTRLEPPFQPQPYEGKRFEKGSEEKFVGKEMARLPEPKPFPPAPRLQPKPVPKPVIEECKGAPPLDKGILLDITKLTGDQCAKMRNDKYNRLCMLPKVCDFEKCDIDTCFDQYSKLRSAVSTYYQAYSDEYKKKPSVNLSKLLTLQRRYDRLNAKLKQCREGKGTKAACNKREKIGNNTYPLVQAVDLLDTQIKEVSSVPDPLKKAEGELESDISAKLKVPGAYETSCMFKTQSEKYGITIDNFYERARQTFLVGQCRKGPNTDNGYKVDASCKYYDRDGTEKTDYNCAQKGITPPEVKTQK